MLDQRETIDSEAGGFLESQEPFFAPSCDDAIDALVSEYQTARNAVDAVAGFFEGPEMLCAAGFFVSAARAKHSYYPLRPEEIFRRDPAISVLDATYWQRAMDLTDVLDFMPESKRAEWREAIEKRTTPAFAEEAVRSTLSALMAQRVGFLSEQVDGIFRALSREHVTNRPEGFSRRMILHYVLDGLGFVNSGKVGNIHDLRFVVAKFMGRGQPSHGSTRDIADLAKTRIGEWVVIDGGAIRLRLYKKGTAHIEVHPQIAVRLNAVLAHLHPAAIPAKHRRPEQAPKAPKDFVLFNNPIPFQVLNVIGTMMRNTYARGENYITAKRETEDRHLWERALDVLAHLGGAVDGDRVLFDYAPQEALQALLASGMLPDAKSHQYYPTPAHIAAQAVAAAEIGQNHICLEPSAGTGALARLMPADRTTCVEISPLHCAALRGIDPGLEVIQDDFLRFARTDRAGRYDRIIMNPPYSQGRAREHVEAAAKLLKPGGRLVAIVPASLRDRIHPGAAVQFRDLEGPGFAGVSIDVCLLIADA
jgi:predicted RNA methylase